MSDGHAENGERKLVQGRLPKDSYWAMKKAMAAANVATNDQFVVEAIEAKTAAILKRRVPA